MTGDGLICHIFNVTNQTVPGQNRRGPLSNGKRREMTRLLCQAIFAYTIIVMAYKEYIGEKIIDGVEVRIKILESALKHGLSTETIIYVLQNHIFDEMVDDDPAKTLMIGYDENANLVEIIAYEMDKDFLILFHAMPCRKEYKKLVFR